MCIGQSPVDECNQSIATTGLVCLCQQVAFYRYGAVGNFVKVSDGRPVHVTQQAEYRRAKGDDIDERQFEGRGPKSLIQEHGGKIRCREWYGSADIPDRCRSSDELGRHRRRSRWSSDRNAGPIRAAKAWCARPLDLHYARDMPAIETRAEAIRFPDRGGGRSARADRSPDRRCAVSSL